MSQRPEGGHALALACLREGVTAVQRRFAGAETLARFAGSHVGALEPDALRTALAASVSALMREGADPNLPMADLVAERLVDLR